MIESMPPSSSPRIAFLHDFRAGGAGGTDLLCFLVNSLSSVQPTTKLSILLPSNSLTSYLVDLAKRQVKGGSGTKAFSKAFDRILMSNIERLGSNVEVASYRNTAAGLANETRRCHADILFLCRRSLGCSFPIPWIGYIADLQHRRMPQWFKRIERWHRDRVFSKILTDAPAVVVNAASVVRDIEEYYPGHRARLFALPFCPPADRKLLSNASDSQVCAAYRLPPAYFMISNQFWIHKSHATAFNALRFVRDAGHDVDIVCTGGTHDYRWPKHFSNLKDLIEKNGIRNYVHILGFIPKVDQLAIMRGSLAVIQPTLFEGGPGGGCVYDAVSTRTPSIISDIPVNREVDIGVVRFFRAGSAEDLAAKMIELLVNPPQRLGEEEVFTKLSDRQKELGKLLLKIASTVTQALPDVENA
jgi:glycosyltransferase involved in cell wall biosynthesis